MDRVKILRRLRAYEKNPELYKDLSNAELASLVFMMLGSFKAIDAAIQSGRLDGYTPKPDQDYLSAEATKRMLAQAIADFSKKNDAAVEKAATTITKKADKALSKVRNGRDGVVSDAEIARAAEAAYNLIQLPDFEVLLQHVITAYPNAIRDGLELIVDEKQKLAQSAVQNLPEDLRQLQEQIARVRASVDGVGTSKHVIDQVILQRIADGTISSTGSVGVETPSGTINGSNTDFTVAHEPKYVVMNALTYFDSAGYSYSGGTITFDIPPATGSVLKSIY